MMKLKTLAAFTEPGDLPYPPYLNITLDQALDVIEVMLRPEAEVIPIFGDTTCTSVTHPGRTAMAILEPSEFERLIGDVLKTCAPEMKGRIIRYADEGA